MRSVIVIATFCAGAAFALAALLFSGSDPGPGEGGSRGTYTFDNSAPVEERIAALESAVSDERLARQLLQEEVVYLTDELERLSASGKPGSPRVTEPGDPADALPPDLPAPPDFRSDRRSRNDPGERRDRLVEAGFLPAQADWILKREQELQMQALQARFDAERSGESVDWMANRTMATDALRTELGDADYEKYLQATGRSTNVAISSVIESSPAQAAGLMPGDEIVRYDGERVFSMYDLTRRTMTGNPGETVVVDIMRDGNLMQVAMPRGPVGVTGGRRQY